LLVFPETALDIVKFDASLIPTLARVVIGSEEDEAEKNQVYADEIKANVCVLMETLSRADSGFGARISEGYGDDLKAVSVRAGGGKRHSKVKTLVKVGGIPFDEALSRLIDVLG
jgi:hypothetical protein